MWDRELKILTDLGVLEGKNETELRYDLPDGKHIYLKGLDKPDTLVGKGLVFIGLDECALHDIEPWQQHLRPMIADTGGDVMFSSSPRGNNWFKQMACLGGMEGDKQKDWVFFRLKTEDAGTVDKETLDTFRVGPTAMPEDIYRQEWEAEFLGYVGLFCPEYIDRVWPFGNILSKADWVAIKKRCIFFRAMDWAITGTTVVHWVAVDPFGRCKVLLVSYWTQTAPFAF